MNAPENNQPQDDNLEGHNAALINARFSDTASEIEHDTERELAADAASAPSYELHTENENRLKENEQKDALEEINGGGPEQTGQSKRAAEGETVKYGEDQGGTTNLSPEQSRKEGGAAR